MERESRSQPSSMIEFLGCEHCSIRFHCLDYMVMGQNMSKPICYIWGLSIVGVPQGRWMIFVNGKIPI